MEGVLDARLRAVLTSVGGIDRCVSEFIRVTDTLLPERVYTRIVPEILNGGCTTSGVPVRPQLLGSDPVCLAENAHRVAELTPHGVDLNFGCPAKVVNRHGGGAALLNAPEQMARIVETVRRAVPAGRSVSAKMRLGWDDDAQALDCARALAESGADEIVVHARTRAQGYRPPAYWARVADVREAVKVPVVVNGDIWTLGDARRARSESGCVDVMIGRGLLSDPGLGLRVTALAGEALARSNPLESATVGQAGAVSVEREPKLAWSIVIGLLVTYAEAVEAGLDVRRHRAGRIKQWLQALRRCYPEADRMYIDLRAVADWSAVVDALKIERAAV